MLFRSLALCGFGMLWAALTAAEDVLIVTENYPPFNFEEEGEIKGIATERVRQIMDRSGLSYRIQLVPWTRAFATATSQAYDNVLIYSLTRNPERETQFEWLAWISSADNYLYALPEVAEAAKSKIDVDHSRAVCVIDDAGCSSLREMGFKEPRLIEVADNESASEISMVLAGRAQFFIANPVYLPFRLKQLNIPADTFKAVQLTRKSDGYYLAGPLHLRADIADRVRKAFRELEASEH